MRMQNAAAQGQRTQVWDLRVWNLVADGGGWEGGLVSNLGVCANLLMGNERRSCTLRARNAIFFSEAHALINPRARQKPDLYM